MQIKGVPNLGAFSVGAAGDSKDSREEPKKDDSKKRRNEKKHNPATDPAGGIGTRIISPSSDLIPDSQIIDSQSVVKLMASKPSSRKHPGNFERRKKRAASVPANRRKIDRSC